MEQVPGGDHDIVRVSAVPDQAHRPVAGRPVVDSFARGHDLAGHLEPRTVGAGRHCIVQSGAHEQVGEVDARRPDPEVHFARTRFRQRDLALDEHFRRSVALDADGAGSGL